SFPTDSKIFTSKFFMTVYEAVFLALRITVEDTCRESMTLLLVTANNYFMLKEISVAVDEEEAVKENRDLSNFAATSYMGNADEEEYTGLIFDDINLGEVFDWEEEVESFIKKLKNSVRYQPATKKRLTSRSLIFNKFQKVSASARISKE
ncbi:hypothetical protein CU098_002260, partial [Rhizopus stolonifer]